MAASKFFYYISSKAPLDSNGLYLDGRGDVKKLYGQTRNLARELKRNSFSHGTYYIWKFDRTTLKLIGKVR